MILDLSGFSSRTQERTFAAAFFDRLYRTNRELVHLIVDEVDLFGPQKPRREDAHLLVTLENIVRRGRNKGIGISMASQRAAVVNKDLLTQVDALAALRVTAPQDRDAIRDWVRDQGDEDIWSKIAPSLPSLANGECWWWLPEKTILKKVQIRRTRTFDSSPTRRRGHSSRPPKTFADVDLASISDRMADTIERAKATDPVALNKRIRELEKALDSRPAAPLDRSALDQLDHAVAALRAAEQATLATTSDLLAHVDQTIVESRTHATQIAKAADTLAVALGAAPRPQPTPDTPATPTKAPKHPETSVPPGSSDKTPDDLSPARQRLVEALHSLTNIGVPHPPKTQLALWAGVSPKSSGFTNNLGALRSAGYIDYPSPGHVTLGALASTVPAPAPIAGTDDLHEKVRGLVSPARWRILAALIDVHPQALSKADLAVAAGVSATSSGFTNNLGALRSMGLLDYPSPGTVAATGVLFL